VGFTTGSFQQPGRARDGRRHGAPDPDGILAGAGPGRKPARWKMPRRRVECERSANGPLPGRLQEVASMPLAEPTLMTRLTSPLAQTAGLLLVSNVFMTFAWYGHLKYSKSPIFLAILASWGLAFFEYCFQVPANRIGYTNQIPTAQLKTIQEVITLAVFCVFSVLYLKEDLKWNYLVGFGLMVAAVFFIFKKW
jgi:hypothetical protein